MPRYLVLDLHCDPCRRLDCRQCVEALRTRGRLDEALAQLADDDPDRLRSVPRLARFARLASGGPLEVKPFRYKGRPVIPYPHQRPDGGVTWQLRCQHGHNTPMREERITAELDAIPPGKDSIRRSV
jgi:hypothetical protein